jgi:hypothetical protein
VADAPPPGRKKGISLPGSPVVWIGVLAVALGAGAWILYKRRSASSSAATTSSGTTTDTTGIDTSGEVGTIQSEIGDLQSSEAQDTTKVQVPNLVGMTQERAFSTLQGAGLRGAGAPVQPGKTLTVTAQAPAAGVLVPSGTFVALQSSVKAPVTKPPAKKPVPKPKPKPKPVPKPRRKVAA